jgi:peroxiredoxin
MIELGQLEKEHQAFSDRKVRIMTISNDSLETAKATQKDFPHLLIASDADQKMARAFEVIHEKAGHDGKDTNAPTTIFVGNDGTVRWLYRPGSFFIRLSPEQVLAAVDGAMATK